MGVHDPEAPNHHTRGGTPPTRGDLKCGEAPRSIETPKHVSLYSCRLRRYVDFNGDHYP